MGAVANAVHREPWNKGKIVGQKAPFKLKDIWALRVRLQWKCHFDAAEPPRGPEHPRDSLDEESALVLEALPPRGMIGPEEIAARAGLALRTVLRRLSLLELAGLVERGEGGVALSRTD